MYQLELSRLTAPFASNSGEPVAVNTGAMLSSTSTVTVVVLIFPEASSAVKVTSTLVPA